MDSPLRPSQSGLAWPGRVMDRTVTWSFGGDWALLRLISTLGASSADLGGSPARQRHTLALSVPTVPAMVDSTTLPERARVFVRVRLRDPVTGAERAMPAFPPFAPALRARAGYDPQALNVTASTDDRYAAAGREGTKWTERRTMGSPSPGDAVQRTGPVADLWARILGWWKESGR
jgi:hypothetical protein